MVHWWFGTTKNNRYLLWSWDVFQNASEAPVSPRKSRWTMSPMSGHMSQEEFDALGYPTIPSHWTKEWMLEQHLGAMPSKLHQFFFGCRFVPYTILGDKETTNGTKKDLNIGETRVWRLDSGPNLQPWFFIILSSSATSTSTSTSRSFGVFLEDRAGKSGSTSEPQPASGRNFAGFRCLKQKSTCGWWDAISCFLIIFLRIELYHSDIYIYLYLYLYLYIYKYIYIYIYIKNISLLKVVERRWGKTNRLVQGFW